MEKIKDVEFRFRGEYLAQVQARRRRKKYNFEINPLENLELPQKELFELCQNKVKEQNYKMRSLEKDKLFFDSIETLITEYISQIELNHLPTQREKENLENEEKDNEGEASENQIIESDQVKFI